MVFKSTWCFLDLTPKRSHFNYLIIHFNRLILFIFIHSLYRNVRNRIAFFELILKRNPLPWIRFLQNFPQGKNLMPLFVFCVSKIGWRTHSLTVNVNKFVWSYQKVFKSISTKFAFTFASDLTELKSNFIIWQKFVTYQTFVSRLDKVCCFHFIKREFCV